MKFNEWLDRKHPEFNEGALGWMVFAALQTLWQYMGGGPEFEFADNFVNHAIQLITHKFNLAEPQAAMFVKQFMCKVGGHC